MKVQEEILEISRQSENQNNIIEKEGEWCQNYHLAFPSTMQELSDCDPYVIFSLFYSSEILNIIVKNMYNRKGKG